MSLSMSASSPSLSERSAPILDWLASETSEDTDLEISALVRHLEEMAGSEINRNQFYRCLELIHTRSLVIAAQMRQHLATGALPLTIGLHRSATRMIGALGKIVDGYEQLLEETRNRLVRTTRRNPETLSAKALRLLGEQLTLSHLAGSAAPFDFWQRAHALFRLSGRDAQTGDGAAEAPESVATAYKYLLCLAATQPEGLTGREICWLSDYIAEHANECRLRDTAPTRNRAAWYWIDPDQNASPVSFSRREPPPVDGLLYFSAEELARGATELIDTLDGDQAPTHDLPAWLRRGEAATLLRRVREYWAAPPHRAHTRRRNQYPITVCCGLESIWKMLRAPAGPRQNRFSTEWMVVNESPTGYAIMQVTGAAANLGPGIALALRRSEDEQWTICVVRWIRTETPEQVELGLQVVANSAKPVTVGFRNSAKAQPMKPALVLPPLPALGKAQSILAPGGTYTARRFMLVSDTQRLYVAQGRLLSLDMQTAAVELFQYEIDPYPL